MIVSMGFIWFSLSVALGIFAGGFLLLQPLIVLLFGIPFTLRLMRKRVIRSKVPLMRQIVPLVLAPILFWASTKVIAHWLPDYVLSYIITAGIVMLFGIPKCFANDDNLKDFVKTHARFIDREAFERVWKEPQ